MTHKSKVNVYILAAIVLAIVVFLLGDYWIAGPILLILFLCAYPESYETKPHALVIRAAVSKHVIPYETISFIGPTAEEGGFRLAAGGLRIKYGPAWELLVSPADQAAFFRDIAARAPHLVRRGERLVATAFA
jgi:hypothetical protein